MPRRLLMSALILLTVGTALIVHSTARGAELAGAKYALFAAGSTQDDSANDNDTGTAAASEDTAAGTCWGDSGQVGTATAEPYTMVVAGDGIADSAALDELRALVDELAAAGELSEAGADKLHEALERALSAVIVSVSPEQAALNSYRTIVLDRGKDGQAKAIAGAYSLALSGEGADGELNISLDEGTGGEPLALSISKDGGVHTLRIETGADGTLTVTGEGFSDEQLEKIRQAVKEAEAKDVNFELRDGEVVLQSSCDSCEDSRALVLEELPELKELARLEELFKQGLISESELEHEAQLLFLENLPELKDLSRLEELKEQGMISEQELLEQLEALKWVNVDTPDLPGGLKELKELQWFTPSDVDVLLNLGGYAGALDLAELDQLLGLVETDNQGALANELEAKLKSIAADSGESAAESDSTLDEDIAAVLKDIEQLLREFAARHADN